MKKARIAILVAAALCTYPLSASAQGKGKKAAAEETEEEAEEEEGSAKESGAAAEEEEGEEGEGEDGEEGEEGEGEPEGGEQGALAGICAVDPEACPKLDFDKEAARDIKEQVYAVQQVFALRVRRLELQPYWALTLNDQFVAHPGPGMGLNYWITQVLAVGVNGTYYQPFNADSDFNFQTRRAARVAVPLTEYQWGAALNFTYVPIAGKFSGFGDFIFQYDAYVVGGVGAISTRPIPTVDPDNRSFDFEPKIAVNAGLGLRIFFSRWFAATLEVRDYVFNDKIEATKVAAVNQLSDEKTWYDDKQRLTNNVQAQLGVSVFIPFSFDYRLPK
ncbi:MAG: outer membrane beta-barrel domain-containing protein [Deltaproteobacteria bacterium]|nr:outer membrane beta-barrel domain-containing protein [Deltaproteobacteria bacterium]